MKGYDFYFNTAMLKVNLMAKFNRIIFYILVDNIALGKPAALSSLWKSYTIASLAVDGSKSTLYKKCAQSEIETNAWLRIDLQANAVVQSVSILSFEKSKRYMQSFDVRVGMISKNGGLENPPCQLNTVIPAYTNTLLLTCPIDMIGRYVTVNTNGSSFIEICEIEVYGSYI